MEIKQITTLTNNLAMTSGMVPFEQARKYVLIGELLACDKRPIMINYHIISLHIIII